MTNHCLSIFSLNARGLREARKRSNLFYWLEKKKVDITFLQETYWTNNMEAQLKLGWEGEVIFSQGTEHSKGTAILFRKDLQYQLLNTHKTEDSRMILSNIKIEEKIITLINIYAPNSTTDRKAFFNKIQKWINKFALNEEALIIGGDFNYTDRPILDRFNFQDASKYLDPSTSNYKTLIANHNLHDIWRDMNPNKQQFTYRECSRIDKFLISNSYTEYIQKSSILVAGIKTDHKCIEIKLNFSETCRGPGRWKLNVNILNDKLYIDLIKNLIKNVKDNFGTLSKQMLWELCKVKIKEKTIIYCKQKAKIKRDLMKELETKIQLKDEEIVSSNYKKKVILERDCLADELHILVQKQKVGAQIRSRAKWVEEGEVSSKYFLNLEQINITNNTIKCLQKEDGTYTKTEDEILKEQHKFYKNLYQDDKIAEEDMNLYLNNLKEHIKLNEEEKQSLEGNINEEECIQALNLMKLNKSPGSDGLPVEFYKALWTDLRGPLLDSLQEAYLKGELSPTQKRGIITLLHKKMKRHC